MREEHFRTRKNKVVCYKCQEQRPTYTCSRCGETGHREDFQKTNFERDCTRGTQQCLECKSGRRKGKICIVDVCKKFVSEENLPASEKKYRKRSLVCTDCQQRGYTAKNVETYTCSSWKKTGGSGIFQAKHFQQAKTRGKRSRNLSQSRPPRRRSTPKRPSVRQ